MTRIDRVFSRLRPHRVLVLAVFDGAAWLAALALFTISRYNPTDRPVAWPDILVLAITAGCLQFVLGGIGRLHHGRASLGSFDELTTLGLVTGTVGAVLSILNVTALDSPVARTVPLAATFMALAIAAWSRAGLRRLRERKHTWQPDEASTPVIILGAGDGGYQLVESMLHDHTHTWRPIALLDDDLLLRHRRFHGVPVLGTLGDIGAAVQHTGCRVVVLAIPSATNELIKSLGRTALDLHLELKIVPPVGDLPDGRVGISDIRDIDVMDLLGRHQIDTDVTSIAHYLRGKRVLVTGAGGSIGSELCRQINRYEPAELMMLDRDESALHAVQLSIYGVAMLDAPGVVLADIRDAETLADIFERRRPQVVFHAAALKHLNMLEQYPVEAVKTNVFGTLAVLQAAARAGVERFVNISTDKAANPCSVLGYTKRLAEGLTAAAAEGSSGTFLSVRFGNVLGSRGSVLTTFAAQIEAGGPVTVTDPLVTRYFMTVQEAVELVIQAAVIGDDGDALVLDMGEPVTIADVAQHLVDWSARDIDIVFTGLHSGEKLHEELFGAGEIDRRPVHPLISHVHVPPVRSDFVDVRLVGAGQDVKNDLARCCAAMRMGELRGVA